VEQLDLVSKDYQAVQKDSQVGVSLQEALILVKSLSGELASLITERELLRKDVKDYAIRLANTEHAAKSTDREKEDLLNLYQSLGADNSQLELNIHKLNQDISLLR
jgi:hypothetical protein